MSSDGQQKEIAIHDLHEEEDETTEWDEEDLHDVVTRAYYCLSRVISIQQPKWLHNEVSKLISDIDNILSWKWLH